MQNGIHFISGLPRSGSTLLAALLRQNPRLHAGMTSPVGSVFSAMLRATSQENEGAVFIDDDQRARLLHGVFTAYYADLAPTKLIFDTNRLWTTKLPALAQLFPNSRVICCVRNPAWVIDSIERLIRRNRFELSRIFNFNSGGTVYSRADGLGSGTGMVGFAWHALREAVFGEHADRLLLVTLRKPDHQPARHPGRDLQFPRRAAVRPRPGTYRTLLRGDRVRRPDGHARPARGGQRRARAAAPDDPAARPVRPVRARCVLGRPGQPARRSADRVIPRAVSPLPSGTPPGCGAGVLGR